MRKTFTAYKINPEGDYKKSKRCKDPENKRMMIFYESGIKTTSKKIKT